MGTENLAEVAITLPLGREHVMREAEKPISTDIVVESIPDPAKVIGVETCVFENTSQQAPSSFVAVKEEQTLAPPYTTFTASQKRLIVLSAATSVLISAITTNIYLPALNILAEHYHVSAPQINLSLTVYMIFQSIMPTFVGGFADNYGRRPAYIICFTIFVIANIGLAVSDTFALLLVLRCFQSIGASALQTLCQAVMADVTTGAERGSYVGFLAMPTVLGPSLGPLLGGALAFSLGWRSIFVFLAAIGLGNLIVLFVFFPETCRKIVGDGSIVPSKRNQSLWQLIKNSPATVDELHVVANAATELASKQRQSPISMLFQSFKLVLEIEFGLVLFYAGLIFAGIFAIGATIPSEFAQIYGLSTFQIGLVYLPMVAGSIVSIILVGPSLNKNFARHAIKNGISREELTGKTQLDMDNFPIERARLEVALPPVILSTLVMICWGWVLEARASLAVPCVLIFLIGVGITSAVNAFTALTADLHHGKAGAAAAANNLIKYMIAAILSAAIGYMVNALGPGWAFTIIGGLYVVFSPCLFIAMFNGLKWRIKRRQNIV